MRSKHLYLALCVLGTVLPYSQFIPFVRANGVDLPLMVEQLFANRIAAFFGLDVVVSTLVLWVLIAVDGRRQRVQHLWAPIIASVTVGVSLGLPLFLYLREMTLDRSTTAS